MIQPLDTPLNVDHVRQGIVYKKSLGKYEVRLNDRTIVGSLSNKLRKQLIYPIADPSSLRRRVMDVQDIDTVDPVAVGDIVTLIDAGDGSGLITDILPRKNKLSRPALDGARRFKKSQPLEQVLVANIDQIVIVTPIANPLPSWELLDRYLAAAEAAHIPAVICFTKLDLLEDSEQQPVQHEGSSRPAVAQNNIAGQLVQQIDIYRAIGYPVIMTSAVNGENVDHVKAALKDRISVLWGKSGVGKTSLLNAIQPGLGLRVNAVNAHNSEGRHTTSHVEMFDFDFGGSVIDTPGQRTFKLWDDTITDFAQLLPEMRPFIGRCKFGIDCHHTREPGCAIKTAVSNGQISQRRYESFLGMRDYFA
jgi:ribosome biogenesis GTPase